MLVQMDGMVWVRGTRPPISQDPKVRKSDKDPIDSTWFTKVVRIQEAIDGSFHVFCFPDPTEPDAKLQELYTLGAGVVFRIAPAAVKYAMSLGTIATLDQIAQDIADELLEAEEEPEEEPGEDPE
jgi:hypothetical protein